MTYWYHENFFGPRFMFELSVILCCLTARGIKAFEIQLPKLRLLPITALLLPYMIALTVQTDLVQRSKLWRESTAPIRAIMSFESKHFELASSNVYLIDGNYSSAVAHIDPTLHQSPILIKEGENAIECAKLLGSRIFKVDKDNIVSPVQIQEK